MFIFRYFSEKGKWPEVSKNVNPKRLQILTFCDKKCYKIVTPKFAIFCSTNCTLKMAKILTNIVGCLHDQHTSFCTYDMMKYKLPGMTSSLIFVIDHIIKRHTNNDTGDTQYSFHKNHKNNCSLGSPVPSLHWCLLTSFDNCGCGAFDLSRSWR